MRFKENKGITLIALVITIIILIILAGITIRLTLGNTGIVNKAQTASEKTIKEAAKEAMNLKITNVQIESYVEKQRMPTLQEIADNFCQDEDFEYVELETKKTASLNKIEVGENESIFTKLKEYPYEFEINSQLQLASIDGVKVATNPNNEIGEMYSKTNTVTISSKGSWVSANEATYTLPAGTWIIDFCFKDETNGTGMWAFRFEEFSISDGYWKSDSNYSNKHFTWVKTFETETTGTFEYYQTISATARNISFNMTAVKIK